MVKFVDERSRQTLEARRRRTSAAPTVDGRICIPALSDVATPLDVVRGSERRARSAPIGAAHTPAISDECLPDLLAQQVRAQPDAIAVVQDADTLTFGELADSGLELAAYLRHLGVGPEDCVGLFVEPSLDLMVGAWGILFAGGAYLPLSPEYPEQRLRHMIEHSRASVILTQERLATRVAQLVPGVTIVTREHAAQLARSSEGARRRGPDAGPRPDNLAYVIYTSGSTGEPKGVMIEQRSIVNQMRWLSAAYGLGRDRVVVQKTPMSFDAAQWEILAPSCGSKVVMGQPGVHRDPERLIDTLERHDVTTLQCVPTLLQALVDSDELHRATSLRQIFSGGEALSRKLARRCIQELPQCQLVNLYGPTECTINTTAFTVDRRSVEDGPDTIALGEPVHNTRCHVLDTAGSPVAAGEVGELCVGGAQVARGYLHRPDLTAERFIANPVRAERQRHPTLYRTGDLAYWSADGALRFAGRADNQVKLRGHRVELDEIKLAIEAHDWVRHAGVLVQDDARSATESLVAFIELNPREAALMDQGNHSVHHQSKGSRLQLKAQLSNLGCRDAGSRVTVDLPGRLPTAEQRRRVFARKTYRFFEGGEVTKADLLRLLGRDAAVTHHLRSAALSLRELGVILRYFGQYLSPDRLLPKYGYASPGSLYATQMYLDLRGIDGLRPGCYYYHPVHHQLIRMGDAGGHDTPCANVHFVGRRRAIEPVYAHNIREVLQIEAGHMVGLFEEILPRYGLTIRDLEHAPATVDRLDCADEDLYLGTFAIGSDARAQRADGLEIYLQAHPGKVVGLPAGQYHFTRGRLVMLSDELILRRHVIAINQQVYERACFGISIVSRVRGDWRSYVDLGRKLQRLMMNDLSLGLMSSGYSSESGNQLPSAKRMQRILTACGRAGGASYFCVGGSVSEEQVRSEGMKEDVVHMKGPLELIRDDLMEMLPAYMVPNRVVVLDELPRTPNGKIDAKALASLEQAPARPVDRRVVNPRTRTEERISRLWHAVFGHEVSVHDDFFEWGGNSLMAVSLMNKVNKEFGKCLPMQTLFDAASVEKLAAAVDRRDPDGSSRLVTLQAEGSRSPVYCWPGLGGYPMNLRPLASRLGIDRPVIGVQAYGVNANEAPHPTIEQMAADDVELIRRRQPEGPYTLWGYSFGARVAFEAAHQLERSGERVESLFLIAPGAPKVRAKDESTYGSAPTYGNPGYTTILFSVFAGSIVGPVLEECLSVARDDDSFASFITRHFVSLDADLVKRIATIVCQTYQFTYEFRELAQRTIEAPITIFKARNDDYSFIEGSSGFSAEPPIVFNLDADHYSMLQEPGVGELARMIRFRLRVEDWQDQPSHPDLCDEGSRAMPHVLKTRGL